MGPRTVYRIAFASVVFLSASFLVGTNVSSASEHPFDEFREQAERPVGERERVAPPRDGITVVTSHLRGDIVAVSPDGSLLYYNGTHDGYWDVDPSPEGKTTVLYAATDEVHDRSLCDPVDGGEYCIRQIVERVNLTTGDVTVLYSRVDPRYHNSEWHDVDRIDESHYVVADMYGDEVFVVNVSSGIVVWEWNAQDYLGLDTGGPYPEDWVHLNDVEVLEDGRIMVSLRNQDQIVFVDPERGVLEDWTLGADDAHDVMFEQHNPDYIPASNGGPAVVIADSENNRLVEYQRTPAGEWSQTWVWQDRRLQWPRDADRLPNGHTLVTDTGGNRVVELDTEGDVVWSLAVSRPYEAERLGTGDESAGGPSATRAGLQSRSVSGERDAESEPPGFLAGVRGAIKGLFPNKVVNGVTNTVPIWMGLFDLIVLLVGTITALVWLGLEMWWSDIGFRNPIVRR